MIYKDAAGWRRVSTPMRRIDLAAATLFIVTREQEKLLLNYRSDKVVCLNPD